MDDTIATVFRVVHFLSIVMLIGSAFYIRFVEKGIERIPAWYVLVPAIGVLGSGAWSFIRMIRLGVPSSWHIIFGIKALFVLHILAIMLLQLRGEVDEAKRKRWMTGIVISGSLVIVLSTTMRLLRGAI